jgi:hypothetical protein
MDMIGKIQLNYVDSYQEITLPHKAKILSLQDQDGVPCIWALGDFSDEGYKRWAKVYKLPTGRLCYPLDNVRYIGTLQEGPFVWHYFIDRMGDD